MLTLPQAIMLAIATLSFGASSAPAGHKQFEARTDTIHQVQNENYRGIKNGPLTLARVYQKYRRAIPEPLARALSAADTAKLHKRGNETGSVSAKPEQWDTEYLTPVSVGTPPQKLNVQIDTGSADFWVFSSELSQQGGDVVESHDDIYSPAKSQSAAVLNGYSWNISYGDGSAASGSVYTDVLKVGGIAALNQTVGAASHVSSSFLEDLNSDGILGFAFRNLSTVEPVPQKTFFENIMDNLEQPLFAVDLKYNKTGSFDFGMINSSKYQGDITYTPVDASAGLWEFSADGYKVGDTAYDNSNVSGIADTGTTLLLLPDDVVGNYYAQVDGAENSTDYGGFIFPCNADLPSFTYTVSVNGSSDGGRDMVIPGTYINFSPVDNQGSCYGAIQSSDGLGVNIYGDVALKAAYVIFKGGDSPELGFAEKA